MAIKRITRRWLFNSFGVIVLIILLLEAAAYFGISSYHYNYVQQTLLSQANVVGTFLRQFPDGSSPQVRDYVSSFSEKARIELMTVDGDGNIVFTSSGFLPDGAAFLPDYEEAVSTGSTGQYVGVVESQRVMAVSVLSQGGDPSLSAVRLITSLEAIDRQISLITLALLVLGAGILLLVLFSSSYFINSIVNPVGEVGETARRIAGGDFEARLEKKTDDEIGELCQIINYMAEELGAAEKLKNDFISSVSHELRTPLTAIQGWGETLLGDGGHDGELLAKGMNVIINETNRLSSMVEELLDFSRMQSGRLKLILTRIDALAELNEAALMYTERAKREGIALECETGELVAPVFGDKNKLRQVFINIIDNAIKYSDRGGSVTVTAQVTPTQLVVKVSDTGVGIKPEDLPQVKTKFYKADTTRRGSGIGLAVAEEIVTRHDGSLDVDSRYGEGTTVTIILPIHNKADELSAVDYHEENPEGPEASPPQGPVPPSP